LYRLRAEAFHQAPYFSKILEKNQDLKESRFDEVMQGLVTLLESNAINKSS
jgi:hypothetical protein